MSEFEIKPKTNLYDGAEDVVSLKSFLLAAVLWLPLAFFLWYGMKGLVIQPVVAGVDAIMPGWLPDLVQDVEQDLIAAEDESMRPVEEGAKEAVKVAVMFVHSKIPAEGHAPNAEGKRPVISIPFNPLMYCYGIPILFGLIMATPLTWRRTFIQMLVGFLVMYPFQVFGVIGEVLKDFAYSYGDGPKQLLAGHGLSDTVIAVWYQFGYLILPPLIPVVCWILLNRDFVEKLRDLALPNLAEEAASEPENTLAGSVPAADSDENIEAREPVGPFSGQNAGTKD